ncbi:BTAD domain-containing putative transcriptional regulator [Actinoplanes subtropicus]|uniref:BTAD domain-containing putative transcriptional regulator n=1 Tax=Actinoplanes subtropicus TaxID=543632 RepID=UPI000690574B|nr:BTAD domain-containing putative transcriptional regulator [Actinoplanes subtropicus]
MATEPLRFEILGEVRAIRAGAPIDLGPAKQRAVLAVLLLQAGRPVPTHQIVDAVWGDEPPENGANVVQKYVAGLRRALDPDRAPRTPGELLALTGSGYVLRTAEATLDTDEFQAAVNRAAAERAAGRPMEAAGTLRSGLALWRAEALSGLTGSVFEAARTRLADARASAWETWAEIGVEQGRATALIPELTRLTEEFPLREGLRTQLMLALHQAGRQAEALAVFRDAREYFLDEFGAEPGERMQEAHRRILRTDQVPAPNPVPVSPPPRPLPLPPSAFPLPAAPIFQPPRRGRRVSATEVIFALVAPFATCLVGCWFYFAYTGARRRQARYFFITAGYIVVWLVAVLLFFLGFSGPVDADTSPVSDTGMTILFLLPFFAAAHGLIVALYAGDFYHKRTMREQARQFVLLAPDRAREMGIGRPDLPLRAVDDGGLVDLNHVDGYDLANATGLPTAQALEIAAHRVANGPFTRPEELVTLGLADERTVKKLAARLVCIPPGPHPMAWPPR